MRMSSKEPVSQQPKSPAVAYEAVESESRFFPLRFKYASPEALISALTEKFVVEKIKEYEFDDHYYRTDGGKTMRIREWKKNDGGVQRRTLPVQIIEAKGVPVLYNGIPFKSGGKKSKQEFDTLQEAKAVLESEGFKYWMTVSKTGGMHYKILGSGVQRRIAFERVTCTEGKKQWSEVMGELEVSSEDRDVAVTAIKEVLAVLSIDPSFLTGESMEMIAVAGFARSG